MSALRRRAGWTLVGLSLALHVLTVFAFSRQPDALAAFTVLPIWTWGGLGLMLAMFAFYFLRAPLSLVMTGVWAVTLLVGADEARVLANVGRSKPLPGPAERHDGSPVIRVVTMNCAIFGFGNPANDIAAWNPDIVLLQDCYPHQVRQIADALYGGRGDYRSHGGTNAVITRWKILREVRNPANRDQQVTVGFPDGSSAEVVNIHLASAATDLRFWRPATWGEHRANRAERRGQLTKALHILEQTTPAFPNMPTLLGGDFNSPAADVVHRQLSRDFVDAFATAGTGWGNTFHRRFPVLRIDLIYATRHFVPVRSRVVESRHSNHRMVVADFLKR
jgi:endonuclease/exonuclease/phosphatase (EEP) superfamily protein YafD